MKTVNGRRSIKFDCHYDGQGLANYVFAENEIDAVLKARIFYKIDENIPVTITKNKDTSTGHMMNGVPARGFNNN